MVCAVLTHYGISATIADDVRNAIRSLETSASAFLLLDLDLEGADLFLDEILTRFYDPPPYLLATDVFLDSAARTDTLNRGADVCLEKSVDAKEVLAVINAALRRTGRIRRSPLRLEPCIIHGEISIDPLRRKVLMAGQPVELTLKEFDILYLLASYPGVVFSKSQIYKHVWNDDYQYATTAVSDHISALRQKLGISAKDNRYIQTVYGAGYRFVAE